MAITRQILTDFQNSFTDRFFRKFVVKWLLKIPPHLKCVATLHCEEEASCCWASAVHANDIQPVWHGFGRRVEAGYYRPDLRWSRSKGERHLLPWHVPVTAAVANDANSSSIWCTPGTASIRPSLTMQLTSGITVFVLVCGRRVDTLNKCCDNIKRLIIQPCDNERFICVNIIRFTNFPKVMWQHK